MKDSRYLIRLANRASFLPDDQSRLLADLRCLAGSLPGSILNLRVTPLALEFDLFGSKDLALDSFIEVWQPIGPVLTARLLEEPFGSVNAEDCMARALSLYKEYRYWEAHEALEPLWKARQGDEKLRIQGLILVAAALVHVQKNEMKVVHPMLREAQKRLGTEPHIYYGWNLKAFRQWLQDAAQSPADALPLLQV